jgi:hypothetical protein
MGSTYGTGDSLRAKAAYRAASGTSFGYSATTAAAPRHQRKVHETLDPQKLNSVGEKIRECLDSDTYPTTRGLVIGFDETGSMGEGPVILQQKLASIKGSLVKSGLDYVQILFGAYGDAHCNEVAPLQVGQFEGGDEMEEWLNNIYIERGGGGNAGETSGLFLYFMGRYSRLDSLIKRDEKGILILIGDECPLPRITREEIKTYIGDDVQADISIQDAVALAQESYDVYFFLVDNTTAKWQNSQKVWEDLLGADHVLVLENLDTVSETAAMLVARLEEVHSIEDALISEGATPEAVQAASKAVAVVQRSSAVVRTVESDGELLEN